MKKKLFLMLCLLLAVVLLTIAVSAESYDEEAAEESGNPVVRIVISLLLGLITAGIVCICVLRSYGIKHKAVEYPFKEFTNMNLQEKSDVMIGRSVTSRVISSGRDNDRK